MAAALQAAGALNLDARCSTTWSPAADVFTHTTDTSNFLILGFLLSKLGLTLALTSLLADLILASQKAPLYLALTSVPTVK